MEIYDAIDPRVVTAALRVLPEPPNYGLNAVLPDRTIDSIEFAIDQIRQTNRAARFRSYDAPVEIGPGPSFVRQTGELPPLGEGYLVGEYRRLLEEKLRGSNIDDRLLRFVLGYARRGFDAIKARMEVARGQVLSTGKFTLVSEGGLHGLEADFGVPNTNFVNPVAAWTDTANANLIRDITAWTDLAEEASGIRPDSMVAGRQATSLAMQNAGIRQLYGNAFGAAQQLSIGQVNQVLAALDLPQFAVDADGKPVRPTRVDVDGTTVSTFPTDKVALFPSNQLGGTLWGPTFEALELAATGLIEATEAPGLIALAMRDGNPGKLFTVVNAVGMPVLEQPSALVVAEIDEAA
jgi:hypothetical protein